MIDHEDINSRKGVQSQMDGQEINQNLENQAIGDEMSEKSSQPSRRWKKGRKISTKYYKRKMTDPPIVKRDH